MINRKAFGFTALCIALFAVLASFIPPDPLTEGLSAAIFIAAAIGITRWGPAAWRVYFPPKNDAQDSTTSLGILGLVLWLISESLRRIYSIIVIQMHRPDWVSEVHVSSALNAVVFVGICLVILATRFEGEKPSRMSGIAMAVITFTGVMLSALGPWIIGHLITPIIGFLGKIGMSMITH